MIRETDDLFMNVSFTQLRANVTANKSSVQNQSDYLARMYDSPRDIRIGAINVSAGNPKNIILSRYFPGTNYLFCGYLQTKDESLVSNLTCQRIVTPPENDDVYYLTAFLTNFSG